MVVAEECVVDARFRDLGCVEGCVRPLALALFAEPRVLGAMEECEVGAGAFGAEPVEEVVGVRRCTVRGAPERDASLELDRPKRRDSLKTWTFELQSTRA